jgi:hypothetical protein
MSEARWLSFKAWPTRQRGRPQWAVAIHQDNPIVRVYRDMTRREFEERLGTGWIDVPTFFLSTGVDAEGEEVGDVWSGNFLKGIRDGWIYPR